jgi:hypothetical protein
VYYSGIRTIQEDFTTAKFLFSPEEKMRGGRGGRGGGTEREKKERRRKEEKV